MVHFSVPPEDPRHPAHPAGQQRGVYNSRMFTKPGTQVRFLLWLYVFIFKEKNLQSHVFLCLRRIFINFYGLEWSEMSFNEDVNHFFIDDCVLMMISVKFIISTVCF